MNNNQTWQDWVKKIINRVNSMNDVDYNQIFEDLEQNNRLGIVSIKAQITKGISDQDKLTLSNFLEKLFKQQLDNEYKTVENQRVFALTEKQLILCLYEIKRDSKQDFDTLDSLISQI